MLKYTKKNPSEKKWYVLYTCPNSEKAAEVELNKNGYETYLPLKLTIKQWNDRKKNILSPLFPGYIFVFCEKEFLYFILESKKICSFVKFGKEAAKITQQEINNLRKLCENRINIEVNNKFQCGEIVRICNGPLQGLEGTIEQDFGLSRFSIYIKELGCTASILVSSEIIEYMTLFVTNTVNKQYRISILRNK
jgi:transcription antitermination factor NusG